MSSARSFDVSSGDPWRWASRGQGGPEAASPAATSGDALRSGETIQPAFDELGLPLSEATFVVVDLETTGTSAVECGITEIGAVKVRGGHVLGEYQTLVNPGQPISAFVATLTGITNSMVVDAPPLSAVLPSFLEFARGTILVAHNAPFDIGFLKAACRRLDYAWPGNPVVDTVALSRRVVTRDEAPNHKLATLAALFGASVTPEHRALADARATVDVLHRLLERLAPLGVTHTADLASAHRSVPDAVRRKHSLADSLPTGPGVYRFHAPDGEVLYVGTSARVRQRVRSYFTESEKRGRIAEMLRIADRVSAIECATILEAQVREIRLIADGRPRYNQRSKNPERSWWVVLNDGTRPRLATTRTVPAGPAALGPCSSRTAALALIASVYQSVSLPGWTLDRGGPFADGDATSVSALLRRLLGADPSPVVAAMQERMARLAADERFEEAAHQRDSLREYLKAGDRHARYHALRDAGRIVAAAAAQRRNGVPDGAWEVHVIDNGRLVAATVAPQAQAVPAVAQAAVQLAEVTTDASQSGNWSQESRIIDAWLRGPGVRLAPECSYRPAWCSPFQAAGDAAGLDLL